MGRLIIGIIIGFVIGVIVQAEYPDTRQALSIIHDRYVIWNDQHIDMNYKARHQQ